MKSSIIHPSTDPSIIYPSIIYPSIHTYIRLPSHHLSIIYWFIIIHPSINQSIYRSIIHSSISLFLSPEHMEGKKKSEINQEVIKCNIKIIISLIMFFRVCLLFFVNFNFFYISNIISIKQPVHIGGLTIRQTLNIICLITNAFNFGGLIDVLNTVNISI